MTAVAIHLPLPIVTYLTRYARRRRAQRLVRRCGLAVFFTLSWALAWCLLDRELGFARGVRGAAGATNIGVVLLIVAPVARRMVMKTNLLAAADEVERRDRRFAERLRTVVSRALGPANLPGSSTLLGALSEEVLDEVARQRRPGELLPWGPALRPWTAGAILAGIFAALALVPVLDMPRLMRRYAMPLRDIAPAATTRLFVTPGDVDLPQGQTLRVRASVQRLGASSLTLHVRPRGQDWTEMPMTLDTGESAVAYEARMPNVTRETEYYVTGGDARSDRFEVRVLRRPAVVMFHVTYAYPPYTALAAKTIDGSDGLLEAPVGTEATIAIRASEPLAAARIVVGGSVVETTATSRTDVREAKITVDADRAFLVRLTSAAGVTGAFRGGRIHALRDRPPVVFVQSEGKPTTAAGATARAAVAYAASDDFGIGRLDAEVRVVSGPSSPDRATPIAIGGDAREQRGAVVIDLAPFHLQEGDQVEIKLRAEDRAGQFAQSEPLRLVIAGGANSAAPPPAAKAAAATRPAGDEAPPLIPTGYDDAIRAYFETIGRRR